ncbi:evC complex member EVC [Anguilla rostrata]|uniref:evC complex member EVC n=1 Tax=Anguilla rostrata TaxID=7938 RepID=UPI0030CD9928
MPDVDSISECSGEVVIEISESLQLFPGLLAVAIVFGVFFGIFAAALLYVFFLKPVLLNRKFQGYDTRKLFEADDLDQEDNKSDSVSVGKKAGQSTALNERERKQLPMNSDVAAFALKAKVVYPINQRYRPLADGASNPSLHENSRLAMLPNPESSSSSSLDSLSQENDEDSSQFVTSSPIPNTFQNERFIRVSHFPETFTCAGFEGRISLYCLGLQNFQHLCSNLQEEKHVFFLQILRILFDECFRKEKIDSAFYSKVLLIQERELQDLKKELSVKLFNSERKEDPNSIYCTLEEIERAGKDRLEHGLQMVMGFSRQVERLCLHLRSRPGALSGEVVRETTRSLIHSLLQVETQLAELQISDTRNTQEKFLWWEELRAWLQSRPALLRQEAVCRLRLVAKALEQLTSDGQLSFSHMERMLSELQSALKEELQHCGEECMKQTKELVSEMYRKADVKKKKLMKSQAKERGRALDNAQHLRDPPEFVKVYYEVLEKQKKQSSDLEEQQEWSVTEAVCELWKRVHSSWSEKLADRVKDLFLTALPAQTQLTADGCDRLRREADRDLSAQLQREETAAKQNLQALQEQLDLDRQVWLEEEALVTASLRHMCDQQLKILRGMSVKQKDLQESVDSLMEEKHRLLLAAVQRLFMARHFTLRALKEMRLSRLKMPSLSDSKVVELEDCSKTQHTPSLSPRAIHKDCPASEAERRLGPEAHLIGQGFHQEFLSELDTGAELLQEHAQLLMGHTLAHSIHRQGDMQPSTQPHPQDSRKLPLVEAASESVYVTRGSVSALIQDYYTQIQGITKAQQQDPQLNLESTGGECDRAGGRSLLYRALQKELANWERKPTSREFHQRVEMQKRKILAQYDVDLEAAYETLRKRKSDLHRAQENLKLQLQEAEEAFMVRLATLARVPLASRESEHADSQTAEEAQDECKRNTGVSKESDCVPQSPGNPRHEQGYFLEETGKRKKRKEMRD